MSKSRRIKPALTQLGWKEDVHLPDLQIAAMVAKVDTGARSSALHAEAISISGRHVLFRLGGKRHKLKLAGTKRIKSSNGHSEVRPMIETEIMLGALSFPVEVTLTDRTDMGVPMLLGREAIKGRFLVNAAKTFILSRKPKSK